MRNLLFLISIVILMSSTVAAQTPAKAEGRRLNNTPTTAAPAATTVQDSTAPKVQSRIKKSGQTGQPEVVQRQMKDKSGKPATQEFRRRQPDVYRCNRPLNERDFQYTYNRLADTRRDQDYAITQFVHRNCVTVDQIARLGGLYNDDADRLLFVFDAFSYCYDFDSYDLLITLFRQGTHITKFNDFIYDNLYEPANGGHYGYNDGGYCWYGTEQGVGGGWNNYSNNGYNNGGGNGYNPPRNDPYFNPNAGSFDDNGGGRGGNGGGGRGGNGGGGRGGNNGGGRDDDGRGGNGGGGRGNNGNGGHNHNDHDDHNHNNQDNNYNPPVNYGPQAMNPNDFNSALAAISRNSFENTRLQMAQQVGGTNWFSTDQIAAICRLFSFDNTRLDFAKFAYARCVDPQNYYRVNEVMQFSSNGSALSNYVMSNPPQQNNYNPNNNNNNNNNNNGNGNGNNNNYNNNNNNNYNAPVAVDANEFQSIRNNIRNKGVESTKLQVAKQICETRYFTAEQITDLARLFGVESYKLDFAKFAYARCADPQNYYKVNSVFGVQSYVRELTEFIRR